MKVADILSQITTQHPNIDIVYLPENMMHFLLTLHISKTIIYMCIHVTTEYFGSFLTWSMQTRPPTITLPPVIVHHIPQTFDYCQTQSASHDPRAAKLSIRNYQHLILNSVGIMKNILWHVGDEWWFTPQRFFFECYIKE